MTERATLSARSASLRRLWASSWVEEEEEGLLDLDALDRTPAPPPPPRAHDPPHNNNPPLIVLCYCYIFFPTWA